MSAQRFFQDASVHTLTIPPNAKVLKAIEYSLVENGEINIILEKNAEATVFLSLEAAKCVIDCKIFDHASLTIICIQESDSVISQKSTVGEGGSIHAHNISLGGMVEHTLESHSLGRSAISNVDWIFYANRSDKQRLSARNIFSGKDGRGQMTMKGVAQEQAHVVCNGMIDIKEDASGTDTYLTENVLMLDASAKVDAIPGLEIKTNDVQASHSATVSKVTPEDLFYFASRGIDQPEARSMYVQGFLSDLTKKISQEEMRELVIKHINKKLLSY